MKEIHRDLAHPQTLRAAARCLEHLSPPIAGKVPEQKHQASEGLALQCSCPCCRQNLPTCWPRSFSFSFGAGAQGLSALSSGGDATEATI